MLSAAGLSGGVTNGKSKTLGLAPGRVRSVLQPPPNDPTAAAKTSVKGAKENARHSTIAFSDLSQLDNLHFYVIKESSFYCWLGEILTDNTWIDLVLYGGSPCSLLY
ncbi:unnamed protein product [Fraxinus pennsylvanica]|uniref:Uncharacterized protein n=1 Tax=Fraxinus pennsylvanica TaxID=56036 RepID=A0AAD1ZVX7_9LAMI|nr:unnamed protein product [Fraxinus pennsylvanica]